MKNTLDRLIDLAIEEDIGCGDITTEAIVSSEEIGMGVINAKQDLILAGIKVAEKVFQKIDRKLEWLPSAEDGESLEEGSLVAEVRGSLSSILKGERIALNFLQHLSGIATFTNLFVKSVEGTGVQVLDTRKTKPGFRELEKEAVKFGHGVNHRMGLFDRYLIKDNHITVAGSITEAVARAKIHNKNGLLIEVEVKDLAELEEALSAGADIVMLDNFLPEMVEKAINMTQKRAKLEVSGNICIENIKKYCKNGVDYISIGAITHSAPAADIHMMIE